MQMLDGVEAVAANDCAKGGADDLQSVRDWMRTQPAFETSRHREMLEALREWLILLGPLPTRQNCRDHID